jgi:hypothetical protein
VALAALLSQTCASRPPPAALCADPVIVAYPPPPAQVERVQELREPPCEWLDGSWEWVGRRWQWTPGAWVIPPAGCTRTGPITVWLPSEERGVLYYRPASFCPSNGDSPSDKACSAPKPCPGARAATSGTPPDPASDAATP